MMTVEQRIRVTTRTTTQKPPFAPPSSFLLVYFRLFLIFYLFIIVCFVYLAVAAAIPHILAPTAFAQLALALATVHHNTRIDNLR